MCVCACMRACVCERERDLELSQQWGSLGPVWAVVTESKTDREYMCVRVPYMMKLLLVSLPLNPIYFIISYGNTMFDLCLFVSCSLSKKHDWGVK
jgi:hypothetical protein